MNNSNHLHINHSINCTNAEFKFNIIYLNINSLLNKIDDIEIMIEDFKDKGILVHFIALTEVRLDDSVCQFYNLPNYNSFYCKKQKNSGGVALFCHQSLSCSPCFQISIANVEILCVSVMPLNIKICVLYKQPPVTFLNFYPIVESFLEKYHNCIIIGDFNIDIRKINYETNRLFNCFFSNSYYLLNKINSEMATRISFREGTGSRTIIDLALSDIAHYKYHLSIQPSPLSDHNLLFLSFGGLSGAAIENLDNVGTIELKRCNYNKFYRMLMNNPYFHSEFDNIETINNCLNYLKSQLNCCTTVIHVLKRDSSKPYHTSTHI